MAQSTYLFSPLTLRGITFKNRIGVSPMCQYSSVDGFATDWHLVHIGSRAVGGAGLVMMEATAVAPEGRITPGCLGIWQDGHIEKLSQITDFAKRQGAVIGIQLAHAGRKASCDLPWQGGRRLSKEKGGWDVLAPSPLPFLRDEPLPVDMGIEDIQRSVTDFAKAAKRAVRAGFQVIEIHAAHGYLLHSFLSPLSNRRQDEYGGSPDHRARFLIETVRAVKDVISPDVVLAVRLSCIDWMEGGLTIEDSVQLAKRLKTEGVDFIDCSSGALVPDAKIVTGPGYQVPFAAEIRKQADIPTAAVGMITKAEQAEDILKSRAADFIFAARAELHDPYWPLHAAETLGVKPEAPLQYLRGFKTA